MAIQSHSSTDAAPKPTGTTGDTSSGDNTNDLGHNSIPFSFLVAFLALFVVFMGIGLFARRIVNFVRLQLGLPIPQPPQRLQRSKRPKPALWDVYPEHSTDVRRWDETKPLSCWFLREDHDPVDAEPSSPVIPHPLDGLPITRTHLMTHTFVGTGRMSIAHLPPPITTTFSSSRPSAGVPVNRLTTRNPVQGLVSNIRDLIHPPVHPDPSSSEKTQIESMRVAVLVAMPSEERRWEEKEKAGRDRTSTASSSSSGGSEEEAGIGRFGEMAVGIADVPWTWAESALEDSDEKT